MGKPIRRPYMPPSKVVSALEALAASDADPEVKHSRADEILLSHVSGAVAEAYEAVKESAEWWACA